MIGTRVKVRKLRQSAVIPGYMTEGASGCDVVADLVEPLEILPRKRHAIPTGLSFEIPEGFEIQVRPRSGFAYKKLNIVPRKPSFYK